MKIKINKILKSPKIWIPLLVTVIILNVIPYIETGETIHLVMIIISLFALIFTTVVSFITRKLRNGEVNENH